MNALALPVAPLRFARGDQLPVGTYTIVFLAGGGGYTVRRSCDQGTWYPIDADKGLWRRWPSFDACAAEVMEGDLFNICDWPHWGSSTL